MLSAVIVAVVSVGNSLLDSLTVPPLPHEIGPLP